nr:hypothetical protein [Tanacetum cinerariifolium]
MPPKPDLVFNTVHIAIETAHSAFTVKLSSSEPAQDLSHTNRPSTPIIEEWVSDSEDDYETTAPQIAYSSSKPISTAVRPIYATVPKIMVTRPRHAHSIDTKSKSTFRRHITRGQSLKISNSSPRVTAAQAPVVSAAKGKKGKWVWRPKCPILDHDSRTTGASMTLKRLYYIDAQGRSKTGVFELSLEQYGVTDVKAAGSVKLFVDSNGVKQV